MSRGQPTTYRQAIGRAALIVGSPLAVWTVLDALFDEISWPTVLLRLLVWAVVSGLMALAFSGGVVPRGDRDDRERDAG